jgi:RND family efflux transporter MFP subunit
MDTSSLLAKLHLAQSSAQQLKIGAAAEVVVPGVSDPVTATVTFISPALDPGSTTVEVWLRLPNASGGLKVGTPVHAVIHGRTVEHALQVPASALLPAADGSVNVMVVGKEGTGKLRPVKLGLRTPESVEIVSGLDTGDMVITQGAYGLDEGTKVKVGAAKPDADDTGGAKD